MCWHQALTHWLTQTRTTDGQPCRTIPPFRGRFQGRRGLRPSKNHNGGGSVGYRVGHKARGSECGPESQRDAFIGRSSTHRLGLLLCFTALHFAHARTHAHAHTHTQTCAGVHTHTRTLAHTRTHTHTHSHAHARTHTDRHTHAHTHTNRL